MSCRTLLFVLALSSLIGRAAEGQTRIVAGKVTDSLTGEPVTSGQVSVVGTTVASMVKDDGTFTVAVPTKDASLTVRSIGFKRKDVVVPATESAVTVSLTRDYFQLEAIVVTGQATGVERKNLANSVATVTADELVKSPTSSVEQSLQGKMAGADINQNNGAPGGGNIVRMRGVTSIIGDFQPLYVVDGVIVSNAEIGRGTNLVTRANTQGGIVPAGPAGDFRSDNQDNAVNRIADLNPNDIETVEVLKGASASAIYGSKASNGVILITTKRGRVGAPQFSITQRFGGSKMSNYYGTRCFNSAADAQAVFGAQGAADYLASNGACNDFERQLYGGTPLGLETAANVSGGTETTKYFTSVLVKHDGGIAPRTYADKQSLRLNLDQAVGSKFSIQVGGDLIHTANDRGLFNNENNGSPLQSALSSMPSFVDYRGVCPDGSRVTDPANPCDGVVYSSTAPYAFSNPFQTVALFTNKESVWRSIATGRLNWNAINETQHNLRFSVNGGGDIFTQRNQVFSPPELQFEQTRGLPGTSVIGYGQSQAFNVNGNTVYTFKTSGGTSATTQLGVQYETSELDRSNTLSQNLVGGQTNAGSGTVTIGQEYREKIHDLGFFGQEEVLLFNERLLLTGGVRADRSSNNSDTEKLYWYPKASVSYRLPVGGLFDELKLRGAAGQSGNRPGYGQKFTNLQPGQVVGIPVTSIAVTTAAPDLRPERQTEYEAGVDATMFKGRMNFEGSIYQKGIKDLLLTRALAPSVGFAQLVYNGPEIRNRGLELAMSGFPVQSTTFQWNLRGTFFMNSCRVQNGLETPFQPNTFFNFAQFGTTQLQNDSSCTQIFANDSVGRLPGDAEAGLGPVGSVISRKIGDNSPDWRGGLSTELTFKRFKFYVLVDHQQGGLITNFSRYTYDAVGNSADQTTPQSSGDLSGDERLAASSKTAFETATWPATYTKLREATVTFDLPASFTKSLWSGARYIRLSASGRNLFTWSHYNKVGYDPEVQQVARSLAVEMTWELWAYPASRSVFFTVDLGF